MQQLVEPAPMTREVMMVAVTFPVQSVITYIPTHFCSTPIPDVSGCWMLQTILGTYFHSNMNVQGLRLTHWGPVTQI
jgi:hypothetical protein